MLLPLLRWQVGSPLRGGFERQCMTSYGAVALACVRCASGYSDGSDGLGGEPSGCPHPRYALLRLESWLRTGSVCRSFDGKCCLVPHERMTKTANSKLFLGRAGQAILLGFVAFALLRVGWDCSSRTYDTSRPEYCEN